MTTALCMYVVRDYGRANGGGGGGGIARCEHITALFFLVAWTQINISGVILNPAFYLDSQVKFTAIRLIVQRAKCAICISPTINGVMNCPAKEKFIRF